MASAPKTNSVQVFGRKKNAVAVALCKAGKGLIKVNGAPLALVEPQTLRIKTMEPILLLGKERFANLDIRIRVKGGGYTSQIYGARSSWWGGAAVRLCCQWEAYPMHRPCACWALTVRAWASHSFVCFARSFGRCVLVCAAIRQALAKAVVAYYQKCKWHLV